MVKTRLVAALLLILSPLLGAAVVTEERVEHYLVASEALVGKEPKALWSAVARHSPIIHEGRTFAGHTQWRVRWRYDYSQRGEQCQITRVNTSLEIVITMPELFAASGGHGMDELFAAFYQRLMAHEQLHADHGRAAAAEIDASLLGFSADCQQLVSAANEQARAIIAAWGAKDRDLDQLTDHGRHPERYP